MSGPNYQPLPLAQPAVVQRYTIDYETVGRSAEDPWPAIDELLARVSDPRWSRDRACFGCMNWKTADGLTNLPFRPGAGSRAVESCSSCHYAKLDQVVIDPADALDNLEAMAALREGWRLALSPKKPKPKRYTRVLHSAAVIPGFSGNKTERYGDLLQRPSSSFSHKPNNPEERTDCPFCQTKNGAQVERYSNIKGNAPPVRFVAISCLVTDCKKRSVQPESEWVTYKKGEKPPETSK